MPLLELRLDLPGVPREAIPAFRADARVLGMFRVSHQATAQRLLEKR